MKSHFLLALSLWASTLVSAQTIPFDGLIIYKNTFSLPNGKKVVGVFPKQMGRQPRYYIKSNYYQSFLQPESMTMQLYSEAANSFAVVLPDNTAELVSNGLRIRETATVEIPTDPSAGTPNVPVPNVLGYTCKKLVMTARDSKVTYYFSDAVKVSPEVFSRQNFGSWSAYMTATNGALPLKFVIENPDYVWTVEAIRLEPKK